MQESDTLIHKEEEKESFNSNKPLHEKSNIYFEHILDRIGFGKYQLLVYSIIVISPIIDGSELINVSLISYVFQEGVWSLTIDQISMVCQVIFAGSTLGFFFSMLLSGHMKRKKAFLIGTSLAIICSFLTFFSQNYIFYMIFRSLYLLFSSFADPTSYSFLIEIVPRAIRGRISVIVRSTASTLGALISILIAYSLEADKKGTENWRYVIIWQAILATFCVILGVIFLEETARYWITKDSKKSFDILERMYERNHGTKLILDEDEKSHLSKLIVDKRSERGGFKELFDKKNRKTTICLLIVWFIMSFVFNGIPYMISVISHSSEEPELNYRALFASILSEVPANFLALYIIEHPFFGRKKTILITLILGSVCSMGIFFFEEYYVVLVFLTKFFFIIHVDVLFPYTAELYHTRCRVQGVGMTSLVQQLGGVAVPLIFLTVLKIQTRFAFVVFSCLLVISSFATWLLPYDTMGAALDDQDDEDLLYDEE